MSTRTTLKKVQGKSKNVARPHKNDTTHANLVARIERRYQAIHLRKMGHTVQEIADALKVTPITIREDIREVLRVSIHETAETSEEERQLQVERLDALLKEYLPLCQLHTEKRVDVTTGKEVLVLTPPNAIYGQLILSIEARRAKLKALDVPETKKLEVSGVRIYPGVDLDEV